MKVEYIGKRSEKWRWSMLRWYECQVNIYYDEEKEGEAFNIIEQYLTQRKGWVIERQGLRNLAIVNMHLGRFEFDDFFVRDWREAKQFARDCGFKIR